jgi:hypothetical protein
MKFFIQSRPGKGTVVELLKMLLRTMELMRPKALGSIAEVLTREKPEEATPATSSSSSTSSGEGLQVTLVASKARQGNFREGNGPTSVLSSCIGFRPQDKKFWCSGRYREEK